MSAVDQLKFERELANKREYTPEEAKQNIAETLLGLAYSTPGIANSMSIRDAFEAREAAAKTDDPQEKKRLNAQAVTSVLSAFLPFSIGSPAGGASARLGTFVPVLEKEKVAAARDVYENLPRSFTRPDLANQETLRRTGVLFGSGGEPKQVVSDKAMRVSNDLRGGETRPLGSIVDHPELFGRIEGLADTPVEVEPAVKAATAGGGFHRPLARTTESGTFQVSENARPKWLKEQMAKLMQYEIGRRAGFAPAARHGIAKNIARIDQTIEAVSKAMEAGATPRKTGMAYIEKLMRAKSRIAIAQEVSGTDPASSPWLREMGYQSPLPENEAARAISRALNSRMAGNVDAEIAMRGVHGTEAPYPYKGRSIGEMITLPPQIDDMGKLSEFLANWRTYGQGAPQSVMRRMPEHLR